MFSIMTNPTAIGAQSAVTNSNNTLSKTIQQLSTGLRINSSADDASGMAVSEKLRGQISGLKVAARNAQDGISLLQTAEANMGTMTSMVQRIRELAVQAGDPGYTASDRVMLQTEVDQLKQEINRVSSSAEFNTKKLLNGDAAALWSSTGNIDAIIKGSTVPGNYNIVSTMVPGTNNVYKSNIMEIANGSTSFDITASGGGIARLDNIQRVLTNANQNIAFAVSNLTVTAPASATTTVIRNGGFDAGITAITTSIVGQAYSVEIEALKDRADGAAAVDGLRFRVQNMITGQMSDWYNADITADGEINTNTKVDLAFTSVGIRGATADIFSGSTSLDGSTLTKGAKFVGIRQNGGNGGSATVAGIASISGGIYGNIADAVTVGGNWGGVMGGSATVEVEALSDKAATDTGRLRYRVTNMATGNQSDWYEFAVNAAGVYTTGINEGFGNTALMQVGLNGVLMPSNTVLQVTNVSFKNGDKYLVSMGGNSYLAAGTSATVTASGANIRIGDGPRVTYKNAVSANNETVLKAFTAQMDASGKVSYGSLDIIMGKMANTTAGTAQIKFLGAGDAASSYTKLGQLASFTNADGRNILDNTQSITMYANNRQTIVTLEKSDTIGDLQSKLSAAMVDALDMGGAGAGVNANLVKYIAKNELTAGGNQAMNGTFVIQGAKLGADSAISFSGNQGVLDALNFDNIQKATDSIMEVTVTNAHTGETIGKDTVSDGILRNVIKNVDIKMDQTLGASVNWDDATKRLLFTPNASTKATLHLVNNATVAAIGANEGQTLDISIGRMDTTALNISDVNVLTTDSSQKAITQLDQALDTINTGRAIIGAQMNRLNYTINNLNVSRENMMAAESRIRDLDIAEASSNLAAQQVRLQAATAMLAQANQLPSYAAQLLR